MKKSSRSAADARYYRRHRAEVRAKRVQRYQAAPAPIKEALRALELARYHGDEEAARARLEATRGELAMAPKREAWKQFKLLLDWGALLPDTDENISGDGWTACPHGRLWVPAFCSGPWMDPRAFIAYGFFGWYAKNGAQVLTCMRGEEIEGHGFVRGGEVEPRRILQYWRYLVDGADNLVAATGSEMDLKLQNEIWHGRLIFPCDIEEFHKAVYAYGELLGLTPEK